MTITFKKGAKSLILIIIKTQNGRSKRLRHKLNKVEDTWIINQEQKSNSKLEGLRCQRHWDVSGHAEDSDQKSGRATLFDNCRSVMESLSNTWV